MDANGTLDIIFQKGKKKTLEFLSQLQIPSFERYTHAQSYKKFIDRSRAYSSIEATMNVIKSKLSISPNELEQTTVDPSDYGTDMWLNVLDLFFCSDNELISYVQDVIGIIAIGKVFDEFLVIACGDGLNGTSIF